jgi:acetyl esterase
VELAREIRDLLAWDQALGRRLGGLSIQEQRRLVDEAVDEHARASGVVVAPVDSVEEALVPVDGGDIRLRIFTPPTERPHGVFFHIHGGGFTLGTIDSIYNDAKCAHICANAGCVVTTVDYRLAPEHPFPTAPEDCYAALRWVTDHAAELHVDPRRIAVGGESAGGNLAAVIALMARDRGTARVAFQLLEVPVTDMSAQSASHPSLALFGTGFGLERAGMEAFQDAYLPSAIDRRDPYVSPLAAADLSGLPAAHIITAELDPLRDSGEAYARRLGEAGVRATLHRQGGQVHGSSILWPIWAPAGQWLEAVVGTLRAALSEPAVAA